jgi:hypothetical protein
MTPQLPPDSVPAVCTAAAGTPNRAERCSSFTPAVATILMSSAGMFHPGARNEAMLKVQFDDDVLGARTLT